MWPSSQTLKMASSRSGAEARSSAGVDDAPGATGAGTGKPNACGFTTAPLFTASREVPGGFARLDGYESGGGRTACCWARPVVWCAVSCASAVVDTGNFADECQGQATGGAQATGAGIACSAWASATRSRATAALAAGSSRAIESHDAAAPCALRRSSCLKLASCVAGGMGWAACDRVPTLRLGFPSAPDSSLARPGGLPGPRDDTAETADRRRSRKDRGALLPRRGRCGLCMRLGLPCSARGGEDIDAAGVLSTLPDVEAARDSLLCGRCGATGARFASEIALRRESTMLLRRPGRDNAGVLRPVEVGRDVPRMAASA